jgi:hypothetical protein
MIFHTASGAITPAIDRTKHYLFNRFNFWTFLKLCLVAMLTDGSGSSFNGNIPTNNQHSSHTFLASAAASSTDFDFLVILPLGLIVLALGIWIWYLIVRLRFAYFHCLVHQIKEVTPGWRLYAQPAARMFQFQLIVSLIFIAAIAVIALPLFFGFHGVFTSGSGASIGVVLLLFAILFPLVAVLVFLGIAFEIITHDFMLPHMALEGMTVREAWHASRARYLAEKSGFWFYGFLRIVLVVVAGLAALMILIVPVLLIALVFVGLYMALNALLVDATGFAEFLRVFLQVLLVAVGAIIALLCIVCTSGTIATWKRNYALIFYGGRFQALGDLLSPPPQPSQPLMPVQTQ